MHVFSFPRMEELGLLRRYREERYRKFVENLLLPQSAAYWPDVAKHIAMYYVDPRDPPDKVVLIQFRSDINPKSPETEAPVPKPTIVYDEYLDAGVFK